MNPYSPDNAAEDTQGDPCPNCGCRTRLDNGECVGCAARREKARREQRRRAEPGTTAAVDVDGSPLNATKETRNP